jgi:DNA-binding response OmpR family regulator
VLTARGGLQDRVTALRSGADDYLHKPFALDELVARLQALLRRPGHLLATPLRLGNLSFDTEARQVLVDQAPFLFAPREQAILELLLRRAGHVVPKKLVEDQLYGLANEASTNAVEVHVHRLRRRLAEVGAAVQIHTVRGVGYLINEVKP